MCNTNLTADNISSVFIGHQLENNARTVNIDVSAWLAAYPGAMISLVLLRPTEDTPYIAVTTTENGVCTWHVSDSDTAIAGMGAGELRANVDDTVVKSAVFTTAISPCLPGTASDTPPEAAQAWVDYIVEIANSIIASRPVSFVIDDNGHLIVTLEDGTVTDLGKVEGTDGFSPTITVKTSTQDTYILTITDINGSYDTPNLLASADEKIAALTARVTAIEDVVPDGATAVNQLATAADVSNAEQSANGYTDEQVGEVTEKVDDITDVIPAGTDISNPLVNSSQMTAAESAANAYTDDKLTLYYTKTQIDAKTILLSEAEWAALANPQSGVFYCVYRPLIPDIYQQVDHIDNSGDAYINTLFTIGGTSSAEVKFRRIGVSAGSTEGSGVFGARASGTKMFTIILGSDERYAYAYSTDFGNTTTRWTTSTQLSKDHVVYREQNKLYFDGNEVALGQSASTFTGSSNALLFTYNNNGTHTPAKQYRVYYCKIWDNGTLVRDMYPVYEKANPTNIGFYDIVNGVFYGKQGSGSFSVGADVALTQNEIIGTYIFK